VPRDVRMTTVPVEEFEEATGMEVSELRPSLAGVLEELVECLQSEESSTSEVHRIRGALLQHYVKGEMVRQLNTLKENPSMEQTKLRVEIERLQTWCENAV